MSEQYNGWTNRETWLVNVWYSPETPEDVDYAQEELEAQLEAMGACCLTDMCYLDSVNWRELREACEEEDSE